MAMYGRILCSTYAALSSPRLFSGNSSVIDIVNQTDLTICMASLLLIVSYH